MPRLSTLTAASALAALAACQTPQAMPDTKIGTASLMLENGQPAGTVDFYSNGSRVFVTAVFGGLTPGEHGFHLHTTGKCTPDFSAAGGHLNPFGKQHGLDNPKGAHLGDMRNVTIAANGAGRTTATLDGDADDVIAAIFDADGTAVMVHSGPDDYVSDPAGDAGSRVACGVVERS